MGRKLQQPPVTPEPWGSDPTAAGVSPNTAPLRPRPTLTAPTGKPNPIATQNTPRSPSRCKPCAPTQRRPGMAHAFPAAQAQLRAVPEDPHGVGITTKGFGIRAALAAPTSRRQPANTKGNTNSRTALSRAPPPERLRIRNLEQTQTLLLFHLFLEAASFPLRNF